MPQRTAPEIHRRAPRPGLCDLWVIPPCSQQVDHNTHLLLPACPRDRGYSQQSGIEGAHRPFAQHLLGLGPLDVQHLRQHLSQQLVVILERNGRHGPRHGEIATPGTPDPDPLVALQKLSLGNEPVEMHPDGRDMQVEAFRNIRSGQSFGVAYEQLEGGVYHRCGILSPRQLPRDHHRHPPEPE